MIENQQNFSLIPKYSYWYISYFCKLLLKLLKDEWNQWTERKTLYSMNPSKLALKVLGFIIWLLLNCSMTHAFCATV